MINSLKDIILNNNGAIKALEFLGNGASIRVVIDEDHDILVSKTAGRISVREFDSSSNRPDITINIPAEIIMSIFSTHAETAHEFIINSADIMTEKTNIEKISLTVHSGIMKLTLLGYLKIIPIGGPKLLKILSRYGIGSVSEIKRKLTKLTNR
ncbi:MAG TPA: hypothetical protein PKG52_06900 [bacterium]|nr:hypothetical protein [bacterium]HPS28805.1 hypothetical protein [bacterium]